MALPRFDKLDEDKRLKILSSAIEEFALRGMEGASLNRIIRRAEISKGAMYYYFEDKQDLYLTTLRHSIAQCLEAIGEPDWEAMSRAQFWPMLERFARKATAYFVEQSEHLHLWRHFLRANRGHSGLCAHGAFIDRSGDATSADLFAQVESQMRAMLKKMLTHGREVGAVRDDMSLSLQMELVEALDVVFDRWMLEHTELSCGAQVDELLRARHGAFFRLLAPDDFTQTFAYQAHHEVS